MTTQTPQSSQHLAAAQELLDELDVVTQEAETGSGTKAVTAVAQAILVLAEQVATIRVLMVEEALVRRAGGQMAPTNGQAPLADAPPAPTNDEATVANTQAGSANGQPAPHEEETPRKRRWW